MCVTVDDIRQAVIELRTKEIKELVNQAISQGLALDVILNDGLITAMDIVGKRFATGEIYVPEMMVSAMTMKMGLEVVKPLLKGAEAESKGTILMATVKGDLHDIGKNIVIMMLEGAGFEVIDLGVDLDVDTLLQKVEEIKPDILGLSALLTTTMPEMQSALNALSQKGLRDKVKIIVGGAPVDAGFAQRIGADGYAEDAAQAVEIARSLVNAPG